MIEVDFFKRDALRPGDLIASLRPFSTMGPIRYLPHPDPHAIHDVSGMFYVADPHAEGTSPTMPAWTLALVLSHKVDHFWYVLLNGDIIILSTTTAADIGFRYLSRGP